MDAEHKFRLFLRLQGDTEFRLWLDSQERKEIVDLVAQTDPVRIYQAQGRVKLIQTMATEMQHARERSSKG